VKDQDAFGFVWNLCCSSFKVYGVSDLEMSSHASIAVRTPSNKFGDTALFSNKLSQLNPSVFILSDTEDEDVSIVNLAKCCNLLQSYKSVGTVQCTPGPISLKISPSVSVGKPLVHPNTCNVGYVLAHVRRTYHRKGSKSKLSKIDFNSFDLRYAKYLPPKYDGNVIFELPPLPEGILPQFGGGLNGMSKQFDSYTWCKKMTTNIKNDLGDPELRLLTFGQKIYTKI
jgi:hypothetical protein